MTIEPNWAQQLTKKLITRMKLVQLHAAYRVQQKGGHQAAQICAAVAARERLLDGGSAANAIDTGVKVGMKINVAMTKTHHLTMRPC